MGKKRKNIYADLRHKSREEEDREKDPITEENKKKTGLKEIKRKEKEN